MFTSVIRKVGVTLTVAGAVVLGLAATAFRTEAGRSMLVRNAVAALNNRVNGTAEIASIGGSFRSGLELRGVQLWDDEGNSLAELPWVSLRYRLRDLIGGRVVLGQLRMRQPTFNFIEADDGALNLLRFLRLTGPGSDSGSGGPPPLIAFRDVEISEGTIHVYTKISEEDTSAGELIEIGGKPRHRRRIEDLNARLPYLRLVSPIPGEEAIRADLGHLAAKISDPELDIRGMRGFVELRGDSLHLELSELRLPNSQVRLRGEIKWPDGPLLFDLDLAANRLLSEDVPKWMAPFPDGIIGSGRFHIESRTSDTLGVSGENVRLRAVREGGTLSGKFALDLGPADYWSVWETDLRLEDFDISYFRLIFDTLPVLGRLSGTVQAVGPHHNLEISADWVFSDSLVSGWPVSSMRGEGNVGVGVPGAFSFNGLTVYESDVSLASIRRLVPRFDLVGRLGIAGELTGVWAQPTLNGEVTHRDAHRPVSRIRGVIKLDTEGELLGIWADVELDSLNVAGLESTYPEIPLHGSFGGRISVGGYLDSLQVNANLMGAAGSISGSGAVVITDESRGVQDLDAFFTRLEPRLSVDSLPSSALTGVVTGTLLQDSGLPPVGRLVFRLDSSIVLGFDFDSLLGTVSFADGMVSIDTLLGWTADGHLSADGELGVREPKSGVLSAHAETDSLLSGLKFFDWLFAGSNGRGNRVLSGGAGIWDIEIEGALESAEVRIDIAVGDLSYGPRHVGRLEIQGTWQTAPPGALSLYVGLDTLAVGDQSFSDLDLWVNGFRDSLSWHGRSRIGVEASINGGGSVVRTVGSTRVNIDSLAFLAPADVWFANENSAVVVADGGVNFHRFKLAGTRTLSELSLEGRVDGLGGTSLEISMRDLEISDILAAAQIKSGVAGGTLNGTIHIGNSLSDPIFDLSIAVRNGNWRETMLPYLEVELGYAGRRLAGEVAVWRTGRRSAQVLVDLPIDLGWGQVDRRQLPGDLTIDVSMDSLDLGFLNGVPSGIDSISGKLDANIMVRGSWDVPGLAGDVRVYDGALTLTGLGVRHEGVSAWLMLSGDTIVVNEITVDGPSGTAVFTGFVHLENLTTAVLALDVSMKEFRAIDVPDFLTLTGDASLSLIGPVFGATVSGTGTVSDGVLYFADLVEKEIIDLEASEFAGVVDMALIRREGLQSGFSNRFVDSLRIDSLRLDMGANAIMRSSEANILLTGQVLVSKVADQYRLDGILNTSRGTYRLPLPLEVTREFTVTRGEVRYLGTADLDAEIDIDAFHEMRTTTGDNVTVFVNVGGTLYVPELTLSSDIRPPIPETEVISYLLWGAPSAQIDRVRSDVVGLFTRELERYVLSDLGVPFDYLRIRFGEAQTFEGTEIAIGQQLLDSKLFLTGTSLLCSNDRARLLKWGASLEFRFGAAWRLSASRDPVRDCNDPGSQSSTLGYQLGVDLFWDKTY